MEPVRLAILSDVHYASDAEKARRNYFLNCVENPWRRKLLKIYRRYYWLRDPFAHNHLLDAFIKQTEDADLVIALGDYSCDSGFIGVSDPATFNSAMECLGKVRKQFRDRFVPVMGDHEIGKKPLGANVGGPRIKSLQRAEKELGVKPFWKVELGRCVCIGVTSTLIAWPVYEPEALSSELAQWRELRSEHLAQIRMAFEDLKPEQKILLFCHDPTALPFLLEEEPIRQKTGQIERTVIGHLHSRWFLFKSRLLCGMPAITFLGHTVKRLSSALRQARSWRPFKLLLCPSLSGIELLKDGGYCTAELFPDGSQPAQFRLHRLARGAGLE